MGWDSGLGRAGTHSSASLLGRGRVRVGGGEGCCISELGVQHKGLIGGEGVHPDWAIFCRSRLVIRPLHRAVIHPVTCSQQLIQFSVCKYNRPANHVPVRLV